MKKSDWNDCKSVNEAWLLVIASSVFIALCTAIILQVAG